jgi:CubicO group peptidase (beta-lactamase class C family)
MPRADLLDSVKAKVPVFAPNQKSTYSNVAFELLGLIIERVSNKTYEQYINDAIFEPLDMTKSTLSQPPDSAGVIPLEPQYWDVDEGVQAPTGGIYSSSNDLSKYLRYILTHYNGITHALNWVHPVSPAEGLRTFYGMPWEIFRTDKILLNSQRVVRFVTKGGGLPGYTSVIITVPEYDLGITILVAGNPALLFKIREIVTLNIVRSAEAIAIRQLQERYSGTYSSSDPELNTTITLVADHRGLVATEIISNSTDMFKTPFFGFMGAPMDQKWYVQLVPTLLYDNETEQAGEKWRMLVAREHDDEYHGIWDDFCPSNVDNSAYGREAINEFVFGDGEGGTFQSVDLPAFRVKLVRTEKEGKDHLAAPEQQEL